VYVVIPAKAGIQPCVGTLDSRFCGNLEMGHLATDCRQDACTTKDSNLVVQASSLQYSRFRGNDEQPSGGERLNT